MTLLLQEVMAQILIQFRIVGCVKYMLALGTSLLCWHNMDHNRCFLSMKHNASIMGRFLPYSKSLSVEKIGILSYSIYSLVYFPIHSFHAKKNLSCDV